MGFKEKYTTKEKVDADSTDTEKLKVVISSDTFALGELLETLTNILNNKRFD